MEDFDSGNNSDSNKEVEVDNDVEGKDRDVNAAVEFPGFETEVVCGEGVENSVEVVTGVIDEPVMADGVVEMEAGEGLEEETTGVAERTEITEGVVPAETSVIAEETEAAEREMDEMKEADGIEEEEMDVVNAAEEMQVTAVAEEMEEGNNAAEEIEEGHHIEGDNAEETVTGNEIDGDNAEVNEEGHGIDVDNVEVNEGHAIDGDNAGETEQAHEIEGDSGQEIEEGHRIDGDNAEEIDNADAIVEGHGIEENIAKETEEGHEIVENIAEEIEGHEIEANTVEEIEEGHEIDENVAEETEGHEIEENTVEETEGQDIEDNNAEETEEGNEIEENIAEGIKEGHEIEGENAEESEEGHDIEENIAEATEGHEIEENNEEEIEEGHDIEENIAEEIEGHEIESDNADEIDGDNAEETEEGHEMEEDNAEEIEEGDNADAEEVEEGDNAEDIEMADGNEEAAADQEEEVSRNSAGKRKRAKNAKAPVRTPSRKKAEEDVCFICFDGGELVLCDRRGCPKAYHPTCVNRDDAFFRAKGRWNCGWHICSNCEKNAYYMCYTCTFSLCKGCVKDATFLCVRGNKGFCESCMKTVMLIEKNEQGNKETAQVDFDDRSSFEYLFKDYWVELKGKLSLTLDELSEAKNPWKGSEVSVGKRESRDELYDVQNDEESGSDDSSGSPEVNTSKRRRAKKRLKSHSKARSSKIRKKLNGTREASTDDSSEWASKELLEFVMHMRNGDRSVCSQFDVQALLLEYIKRNKLRDPRRKSQIICDSRLEKLFGKSRVGHFEMLKLLESHFLLKEDSQVDDLQGSVVDTEANQSEIDGSDGLIKGKDRRRKARKKNGGGLQSNLDDYAAIDTNNINLIYLRRSLVENLIDDTETFHDKVVGAFVRIRISGSVQTQKQDLYRLVQVVGTSKAAEPYKVGKKTTEFLLEILNLNKTEIVSIDIISNQDFTEDECKRLRQSIKCGLINRLTVGDIQEKAMVLQAVRVADSLETEITRYSHLRDRASDMGRRKELRECVEKLQLLKSPGERKRRLEEIPEVHADPNMDPSYESEDDDDEIDDKKQENSLRSGGSSFNRRGRDPISPGRDSWSGTRSYSGTNRELSRSSSNKGFSIRGDDIPRDGDMIETQQSPNWERPKSVSHLDNKSPHMSVPSESIPSVKQEIAVGPSSKPVVPSNTQINETEKIWHYKDPSGKIQGPFSMVQLRKWSNTGYFPADLRIWRATEKQDDSILLTDALAGNFYREPKLAMPAPLEISKYSTDKWNSDTNLPSPTPAQAARIGSKGQPRESRWSPTPAPAVDSQLATTPLPLSMKTLNSANSPHMSTLPSELPRVQQANVAVDLKNLQNFSALKPEMAVAHPVSQPSAYGAYNSASSFIAGNPSAQPIGQPSGQSIAPFVTSLANNQTTTPRPGLENQNTGWGPIPNMGWGGPAPTNSNQGWPASSHQRPGPAPVAPNPGWTGHGQGWANPAQGQPLSNPYPGWTQGPGPVTNQGWVPPGQGPQQGNGPSQPAAPTKPNMGSWANEKGGDRFSNRRDSGPWNRQQANSRGGDSSSRGPYKGQRVCKYHESGHCRKGAACDYMHS